jgi:hypothetical protein
MKPFDRTTSKVASNTPAFEQQRLNEIAIAVAGPFG